MRHRKTHLLIAPPAARAYCIIVFHNVEDFLYVRSKLIALLGAIDYETENYSARYWSSPQHVSYRSLRFLSFRRAVKREELVNLRQSTLSIENKRQNNSIPLLAMDIGYVSQYNVVRATLQDDFHCVYLYGGVFAESIYYFSGFSFQPFSYTSEFFCRHDIISNFNDIRMIHLAD